MNDSVVRGDTNESVIPPDAGAARETGTGEIEYVGDAMVGIDSRATADGGARADAEDATVESAVQRPDTLSDISSATDEAPDATAVLDLAVAERDEGADVPPVLDLVPALALEPGPEPGTEPGPEPGAEPGPADGGPEPAPEPGPEAPDAGADIASDTGTVNPCSGATDFTPCTLATIPDRHYDICVNQICVSPGCGDVTCNVPGPHFPLADTNQRLCYDKSAPLSCLTWRDQFFAQGQDAQYGWDTLNDASLRYTRTLSVANQPVVQDNVTGLSWQGCPAGLTASACDSGSIAGYAWQDAVAYCDSLNWGGYQDWHLPDPFEFHSIADLGTSTPPPVDTTAFPGTPSGSFWSSSTYAVLPNDALSVVGGSMSALGKTGSHYVRCVRGGTAWAQGQRFSLNTTVTGQPIVADSATGLLWQGCSAGLSDNACATGSANASGWADALDYCVLLTWGGYQDWRLPNPKELRSIVNERSGNPAIDVVMFPNTPPDFFWSSSSQAGGPTSAWGAYFLGDAVVTRNKNLDGYFRCVRGG